MLKIERILCPLDFSEFSVTAYDYAQSLAQHYGSELFLEHVVQPLTFTYPYFALPDSFDQLYGNLRTDAEKQLQEFAKSHARNGTEPKSVVQEGLPIESILSFASGNSVDLIVMGTHGYRGLDRLAMGSVTEKILRKARCPVLVVGKPVNGFIQPPNGHDPVNLRKILFCTDFSENSDRALAYALSLALEYNSELTLLHVLGDLPNSTDLPAETGRVVRRLEAPIPPDARNWCTIRPVVRIGKTYQEIIQLALEAQADLVIMGVRGRNALDVALFGSTTHRVIQLGSSPVLAVHI